MKTEWVDKIPEGMQGNYGSKYDSIITEVIKTQRIAKLSFSTPYERLKKYNALYQLVMRRQYAVRLSMRGNDLYISPKIQEKRKKP